MHRGLIKALRARGVDVQTAEEVGFRPRPDEEHLRYAASQNRALFTFNVGDFYRIHTEQLEKGRGHAGLILAKQEGFQVGRYMRGLLRLIGKLSADEMRNRAEFLSGWL